MTLIDTGADDTTGGRLKRIRNEIAEESSFCFTYGDAVSDLNIGALLEFLCKPWATSATVTAVRPAARFGVPKNERGYYVTGFPRKTAW